MLSIPVSLFQPRLQAQWVGAHISKHSTGRGRTDRGKVVSLIFRLALAFIFVGTLWSYAGAFCSLCNELRLNLELGEDGRRRRDPERASRVEVAIGEDQKRRRGE